jgi:hypothetical protein
MAEPSGGHVFHANATKPRLEISNDNHRKSANPKTWDMSDIPSLPPVAYSCSRSEPALSDAMLQMWFGNRRKLGAKARFIILKAGQV